jgi:hypothetical protein
LIQAKVAALIQGKQMNIYKTPASKFVTKSPTIILVYLCGHLQHKTCWSKHHRHTSCLMSYCWLTSDNFHHRHQGKSLQIDQLKHEQLKFPIIY